MRIYVLEEYNQTNKLTRYWLFDELEKLLSFDSFCKDQPKAKEGFTYQINISVSPTDAAVIQGAGIYPYGETATLSVSSLGAGYQFGSWSGGISGNSNPLTFSVNQDTNITANFEVINYELNVTVVSGGTVSGSGLFPYGNLAQISATASDGYTLSLIHI